MPTEETTEATGATGSKPFPVAVELFQHLEPAEQQALAAACTILDVSRGDTLVREGDTADAMYWVVTGRFAVLVGPQEVPLDEIGVGQPVGEIACLTGGTRTATVRALRDGRVLRLDRPAFDRVAASHPGIWRALSLALAGRLTRTTAKATAAAPRQPRTITVIGTGGASVPPAFVDRLCAELSRSGKLLRIDANSAHGLLLRDTDMTSPRATALLNEAEANNDIVVYVADREPSPFSSKAIRAADLLLIVGHANGDPKPGPLELEARRFLDPRHSRLVLLHPERGRAKGTSRWLAGRDVIMHHHVCLIDDADIARLARFLTGRASGLVACGGGAWCTAHIGVYKALREAGTDFDIVGGTSAGSAMAAAFGIGLSPAEITRAVHDIFVENAAMRRYTWPRYSILDHTHFDRQLARYFGDIEIEDLWRPYFAVSTDLSSCRSHCHTRGDLLMAVRASSSIPVLLPPVYTGNGHMLVDGCVLDNVPAGIMHGLKSGPNVVISFLAPELERFAVDYRALPSRNELIMRTLLPWRGPPLPSAPGLADVLMRSLMANRNDFAQHLGPDDVLLIPPVPSGTGFFDWHKQAATIDAAYRWARDEIARLRSADQPPPALSPLPT